MSHVAGTAAGILVNLGVVIPPSAKACHRGSVTVAQKHGSCSKKKKMIALLTATAHPLLTLAVA